MATKLDETKALLKPILEQHVPVHADAFLGDDALMEKATQAVYAMRSDNLPDQIRDGSMQLFEKALEKNLRNTGLDRELAFTIRVDLQTATAAVEPNRINDSASNYLGR